MPVLAYPGALRPIRARRSAGVAQVSRDTYCRTRSYNEISISLIPTAPPVAYIGCERVMNEMPKPLQVYIIEDSEIVERFLPLRSWRRGRR